MRSSVVALVIALSSFTPSHAQTKPAAGPLSQLLRERQTKIDGIVSASKELSAEAKAALAQVLAELLDFEAMSQSALGSRWAEQAEADRAAFVRAFERLIRASSVRNVDIYRNKSVAYGEESVDQSEGRVSTTVSSKDSITEVQYAFSRRGDAWTIVDYDIDGVSAVRNYRRQFRKIIDRDGFPALLAKLNERAAKLERGEADDAADD